MLLKRRSMWIRVSLNFKVIISQCLYLMKEIVTTLKGITQYLPSFKLQKAWIDHQLSIPGFASVYANDLANAISPIRVMMLNSVEISTVCAAKSGSF